MAKIAINYVIQNDPWDNISEPNVYFLPGTYTDLNKITAKLIYDTFPIQSQTFFFRFYLFDKIENLKLWMDLPQNATIPVYTDKVFIKALRIPKDTKVNLPTANEKINVKVKASEVKKNEKSKESVDQNKTKQSEGDLFSSITNNKEANNPTSTTKVKSPNITQTNSNIFGINDDLINNLQNNLGNKKTATTSTNQANSKTDNFDGFIFDNNTDNKDVSKNNQGNTNNNTVSSGVPFDIFNQTSNNEPQANNNDIKKDSSFKSKLIHYN